MRTKLVIGLSSFSVLPVVAAIMLLSLLPATTACCPPTPPSGEPEITQPPPTRVKPTTVPPTSPPSCPQIGYDHKAEIDNPQDPNDASSIEVFAKTCACFDIGDLRDDVEGLSITPVNPLDWPDCPYGGCLAAVNVGPDDVMITCRPKAELGYDLDVHKPTMGAADCEGQLCYSIYQYDLSLTQWRFVGEARPKHIVDRWFAIGEIDHFSIFGLVELPPPTVPGPATVGMIVASDFVHDGQGNIGVSFIINRDDSGDLEPSEDQRLFHFSGVGAPVPFEGEVPQGCLAPLGFAVQLTCLFPIGTEIELEITTEETVVLRVPERYAITFSVSNVQVY